MRTRNNRIFQVIALLSIAISMNIGCGTKKKIIKTTDNVDSAVHIPKMESPQDYLKNTISFSTFDGHADVAVSGRDVEQNGTILLKMKDNRQIWSSVRALGGFFEAGQALATPDSLYAVLRLMRAYYQLSFEEGTKLIHTPLSFQALQNLLIGNPIFSKPDKVNFERNAGLENIVINIQKDSFDVLLTFEKHSKKLLRQDISIKNRNDFYMSCKYSAYQMIEQQLFASNRQITLKNENKDYQISMQFTSANFNKPVHIKFNVPVNYKQTKIR